jgi:hypothetical protein
MNRIFSILFCMLLWSTTALAGELSVRDSTNWIPANDVAQLHSDSKNWPFDVNILIENVSNLNALESDARGLVNKPSTMVIAIDPTHRKTVVRFGASVGVQASDYNDISAAGNSDFKLNFIRQGLDAIVAKAVSSRNPASGTDTSSDKPGISNMWIFFIVSALFGGGLLIVLLIRKITTQSKPTPTHFDPFMHDSTRSGSGLNQSVGSTAPSNVVVNQSNNDLLTGLLVGEVLSNQNRTEVIHESSTVPAPEPSSSDSGGSSSSWDSSSSSSDSSSSDSSSSDSGGSSSSWDSGSSGGGFDSGGGGFDSGGGSGGW